MCQNPSPLEHFWLMQMLENFGAKRNFIILYFLITSMSKNRFSSTEAADIIDAANKFSFKPKDA